MKRSSEEEKHEYQYGKNDNYDNGHRGKCINGGGRHKLEQVKSFKYLRVQIQNSGKQEAEINERISTAMMICYMPNRNFLRVSAITKRAK